MEKKFYIQPQIYMVQAAPQAIVCTSPQFGEQQNGTKDAPKFGDAPQRKVNVMYI